MSDTLFLVMITAHSFALNSSTYSPASTLILIVVDIAAIFENASIWNFYAFLHLAFLTSPSRCRLDSPWDFQRIFQLSETVIPHETWLLIGIAILQSFILVRTQSVSVLQLRTPPFVFLPLSISFYLCYLHLISMSFDCSDAYWSRIRALLFFSMHATALARYSSDYLFFSACLSLLCSTDPLIVAFHLSCEYLS